MMKLMALNVFLKSTLVMNRKQLSGKFACFNLDRFKLYGGRDPAYARRC